ncbi:hypothetical protein ACWD00_32940 [Streptomyces viridiviolaceus]
MLAALFCAMAGYAFDKFTFPRKGMLYGLVLLGVMIPNAALVLPTYLLASHFDLVNTFWGVFVPGLVFPFGVYLARIFSASYVPDEVIEATRMDGAGELRALLVGRAAHDEIRLRHHRAVPVHRDLEQLLPALGDALGRKPLPGQPRPLHLEGALVPGRGSGLRLGQRERT